MKFTSELPQPDKQAEQYSQQLIKRIRSEIEKNQGSISFRRYMEMALYEKGLGYYVAGARKIGAEGDFITAPEVSSLFSKCIAQQCQQILANTNGSILELGAGSGKMAVDILLELESQNTLPEHYYILDLSPELKQRQQQTFIDNASHLLNHVEWLVELPHDFKGVVIGNEVLDAMPVDLFTQHNGQILEHQIVWQDGQLLTQLNPADDDLTQAVKSLKIDDQGAPYTSEINPNLDGWFAAVSQCLSKGVLLLIDYGYTASEYYHPDRSMGTLICHYQHRVNDSPLTYPGLQDITASVDFSAVANTAHRAGFEILGYTPQAAFLAGNKLEHFFNATLDEKPEKQYQLAQQIRTLTMPSEMGERFKVIALGKNYDQALDGFTMVDQLHRL